MDQPIRGRARQLVAWVTGGSMHEQSVFIVFSTGVQRICHYIPIGHAVTRLRTSRALPESVPQRIWLLVSERT
eukprot:4137443-Pyramimonas_sp.AAC.1